MTSFTEGRKAQPYLHELLKYYYDNDAPCIKSLVKEIRKYRSCSEGQAATTAREIIRKALSNITDRYHRVHRNCQYCKAKTRQEKAKHIPCGGLTFSLYLYLRYIKYPERGAGLVAKTVINTLRGIESGSPKKIYYWMSKDGWDLFAECFDEAKSEYLNFSGGMDNIDKWIDHLLFTNGSVTPSDFTEAVVALYLLDDMLPNNSIFSRRNDGYVLKGLSCKGKKAEIHHDAHNSSTALILDRNYSSPDYCLDSEIILSLEGNTIIWKSKKDDKELRLHIDDTDPEYTTSLFGRIISGRKALNIDYEVKPISGTAKGKVLICDDNPFKRNTLIEFSLKAGFSSDNVHDFACMEDMMAYRKKLGKVKEKIFIISDLGGVNRGGGDFFGYKTNASKNQTNPDQALFSILQMRAHYPTDVVCILSRLFTYKAPLFAEKYNIDYITWRDFGAHNFVYGLREKADGKVGAHLTTLLVSKVQRFFEKMHGGTDNPTDDTPNDDSNIVEFDKAA